MKVISEFIFFLAIYPIVDFLVSSECWTDEFAIDSAWPAPICTETGAAGMVVYMGGAPADVKTGAAYPCCIVIGTAITSNKQNETDFPHGTKCEKLVKDSTKVYISRQ